MSTAAKVATGSSLGPSLVATAGALGSDVLSMYEASKNRSFQARMANTAHQREVADLRAAGLNPILSATGGSGAASPSGSMPTIHDLGQTITSAQQLRQQRDLISSQIVKNDADAGVAQATKENIEQDTVSKIAFNEFVGQRANAELQELVTRIGRNLVERESTAADVQRKAAENRVLLNDAFAKAKSEPRRMSGSRLTTC